MNLTLTSEQVKNLFFREEEDGNLVQVECDAWVSEGKYEYCGMIIQDKTTGKHYSVDLSRSGSYFTEWYYCWEYTKTYEAVEVTKQEVTTVVWKAVE